MVDGNPIPARDPEEYRILGTVIVDDHPTMHAGQRYLARMMDIRVQWDDGTWSTMRIEGQDSLRGSPRGLRIDATMHHNSVSEEIRDARIGSWRIPMGAQITLDIEVDNIGKLMEHRRAQNVHFCIRCGNLLYEDDAAWQHLEAGKPEPICGGGCDAEEPK